MTDTVDYGTEDSRFSDYYGSLQGIVTSSSQNDSGMFETNLHDERYLPFENSGVISEWRLQLPANPSKGDPCQFDYDTITDVILHLRYTARAGGGLLHDSAIANLKTRIEDAQTVGSVRLFSIRHEFPTEWAKFKSAKLDDTAKTAELSLDLHEEHYPFWSRGRLGTVKRVNVFAKTSTHVDRFDRPSPDDGSAKKDQLVKDVPTIGFYGSKLANIPLPPPIGKLTLYLNDKSMTDLWVALTWGK